MKKPQCVKPTSYNCGAACINVSKSCQQVPSESFGRSRLQKLKQIASIYAKQNTAKSQRQGATANKIIGSIEEKRKTEATSLAQDRKVINQDRRKARLKAEAKAKREQLLKMYEDVSKTSTSKGNVPKLLNTEAPDRELTRLKNKYEKQSVETAKTNLQKAERVLSGALKTIGEMKQESDKFLEETRKLVQVDKPTKLNSSVKTGTPNAHQKGVEAFQKMISIPGLDTPVNIVETPPERKGRSCYKPKTNNVFMGNSDPAVVVHEMSHWLEEKVPGIREEVQEFYNKRTQGEKNIKLSEVTGNKNYGDGEVTKVDKWLNPYMGKEYKNASEILSMGMEIMYRNPAYLAKNDPEMFDFIYSVVRRG